MRKLALDIGNARIGVAISQDSLSLPHSVIANSENSIAEILTLVQSEQPQCIYIGLPLSLSGSHTQSTKMAIDFARQLETMVAIPIRMIDERLTSKSASAALRAAGKNSRQQKGIIDASAAALILEFALSSEREGLAGKSLEDIDA
ncbi:MAG: Holliday junction resolvase RuvX [Aquiluna sp.]|nr:Holliday junction resolvase RuvX [Aquiluna sp.]MDP4886631.1 Holliday junction resolvase RuvX [Aquiluna sp.]